MKKLFMVLVVLVAVGTGAFAQDVFASYSAPGDINLYASVGWAWNLEVSAAAEYMVGEFALGPLPVDWGVMVRGAFDVGSYFGFGIGALATLHTGLAAFPVEFYIALGAAYYSWGTGFPVTFASYNGATWWFSKNMGLVVEGGYVGIGFWGVGIEFKL
jgi:hypothetical protein